jgi:hypothetical protein
VARNRRSAAGPHTKDLRMADTSPRNKRHAFGTIIARHCFDRFAKFVVATVCLLPNLARSDDPPLAPSPPKKQAELEPEEVARRFFVAVLTRDKPAIERYILPEEHSELLWKGPIVSEAARRAAHKQVDGMQFKRLQPGDTVTAANGKEYKVDERQINAERVLLLPDGFRFPFALVKQPDGWKVKATTMIVARLEASVKKGSKSDE